ncbi:hypothetical protein GJ25_gp081 [Mycobacterium phage Hawkeye]|uniref:Uncharacterized protein n=1 Tax=Mycobacterium phage Hawkeye TaxID=1458711 RepID=X2KNA2_9CAUD|nr:hypothetical protein GJ25_gp081 [Mycobacterium phage Hawkeye]AHN84092.1 hypothetical protein PBI_HAWKEYE_81 [Mycobacterium phage Hawkeye]
MTAAADTGMCKMCGRVVLKAELKLHWLHGYLCQLCNNGIKKIQEKVFPGGASQSRSEGGMNVGNHSD